MTARTDSLVVLPGQSRLEASVKAKVVAAREGVPLRRRDDRRMRVVMMWAAVVSALANAGFAYAVFKLNILHPLFVMMETHSNIEDKLSVMGLTVLFTLLFLTLFYTAKVNRLLQDVSRLAMERDRANQSRNQRQRLEAVGVMAAGISHEINSSLQVILASCEQAKAKMSDPEESLRLIERAIESGLHAKRVTSNVLMFSKDGGAASPMPVRMRTVVEEALEFSRAFLPQTVAVNMELEDRKIVLAVDRAAFIQVVSNLVNNAAHAIGFLGVVRVVCSKVKLDEAKAAALGLAAGTYGQIEVIDRGRGMSGEQLAKIFDPFYTTKRAGEGTGLGLSIVHGLVRQMRGGVSVASEVGMGSVFTLVLPLAKEA